MTEFEQQVAQVLKELRSRWVPLPNGERDLMDELAHRVAAAIEAACQGMPAERALAALRGEKA